MGEGRRQKPGGVETHPEVGRSAKSGSRLLGTAATQALVTPQEQDVNKGLRYPKYRGAFGDSMESLVGLLGTRRHSPQPAVHYRGPVLGENEGRWASPHATLRTGEGRARQLRRRCTDALTTAPPGSTRSRLVRRL